MTHTGWQRVLWKQVGLRFGDEFKVTPSLSHLTHELQLSGRAFLFLSAFNQTVCDHFTCTCESGNECRVAPKTSRSLNHLNRSIFAADMKFCFSLGGVSTVCLFTGDLTFLQQFHDSWTQMNSTHPFLKVWMFKYLFVLDVWIRSLSQHAKTGSEKAEKLPAQQFTFRHIMTKNTKRDYRLLWPNK